MDILQERSLEGTGADCPCVLKDELTGKTASLDEQAAFEGTKGKKTKKRKRKEGLASHEMFKDVARSCRKKIREEKPN